MRAFLIVGKKGQRLQWVLLFMISCPRPLHPQLWRFCAKMKIHRCPLQDNDFHYFHDLLNHHQGDDENWDNNVMTERSREGTAASVRAVMEEGGTPNLHFPHLHQTQIYKTHIYTKPRFTQTQIYTAQIYTHPNLHSPILAYPNLHNSNLHKTEPKFTQPKFTQNPNL